MSNFDRSRRLTESSTPVLICGVSKLKTQVLNPSRIPVHEQFLEKHFNADYPLSPDTDSGRSRREFLRAVSGMAAAFLGINRVYGRIFEVLKPEASREFVFDDAHLDLTRFAAEHWNPLMLEELYLDQKRFE